MLERAEIFYRISPRDQVLLHVDYEMHDENNQIVYTTAGINIELSGSGLMEFYNIPNTCGIYNVTPTGQPYIYFNNYSQEHLIDTLNFSGNVSLVRTDVPHLVKCDISPRLLISFRFRTADGHLLSWEDSVKHLADCVIER